MNFRTLKYHGHLIKEFRYIKPDGDGFIYYPNPNYKGYKANSAEELHKIMVLHKSIYDLFYSATFIIFLTCLIFLYSSFNEGIFNGLILWSLGTFSVSIVIMALTYWHLNRKYEKVEPEIKTIKEPIWQYNIKIFLIFSCFLVLYLLFFFFKYPYPFYGLLLVKENYPKALKVINLAIKINPKNESSYADRAWVKLKLGNSLGAMDDFNKAISLKPQEAYLYLDRAYLKTETKNYKGASEDYNKAIALQKDASCYVSKRGVFYYETGEYEKAIKDFDIAYEKSGDDWNLFSKGLVKEAQNDYCGALKEYNNIKNDKKMNDLIVHKSHSRYMCYSK